MHRKDVSRSPSGTDVERVGFRYRAAAAESMGLALNTEDTARRLTLRAEARKWLRTT